LLFNKLPAATTLREAVCCMQCSKDLRLLFNKPPAATTLREAVCQHLAAITIG
jgi:hypothetical protein